MDPQDEARAIEIAKEIAVDLNLEQAVHELGFRLDTEIGAAALKILAKHTGRTIARRERFARQF